MSEVVLASVQGLLNYIPYAGSTLVLILSEYRGRRTAEKIFYTLSCLREELEKLSDLKRNIQSEDEVQMFGGPDKFPVTI